MRLQGQREHDRAPDQKQYCNLSIRISNQSSVCLKEIDVAIWGGEGNRYLCLGRPNNSENELTKINVSVISISYVSVCTKLFCRFVSILHLTTNSVIFGNNDAVQHPHGELKDEDGEQAVVEFHLIFDLT